MLRDGQFVREERVKIGSSYTPPPSRCMSVDEEKIQDALLARDLVFWNRLVRKMVAS